MAARGELRVARTQVLGVGDQPRRDAGALEERKNMCKLLAAARLVLTAPDLRESSATSEREEADDEGSGAVS